MRRAASAATALLIAALAAGQPAIGAAHVADETPWSETYPELAELFPAADPDGWRIAEYRVSRRQAEALQGALGFELEPEDLTPEFYLAQDRDGELIGVAMFVRPHRGALAHAQFDVGVAVDPDGNVANLNVHDPALPALGSRDFLEQLHGRSLDSSFAVDGDEIRPVRGHRAQSQAVADAAREALLFMKFALGR